MATPAQALTAIAAKVVTDLSATRLASDHRDDLQRLTAGTLYYQLRGFPVGKAPRSGGHLDMAVEIILAFRLNSTERAYTEGALQTHIATLVDRSWWSDISEVSNVGDTGTVEVTREQNVVVASLGTRIEVTGS